MRTRRIAARFCLVAGLFAGLFAVALGCREPAPATRPADDGQVTYYGSIDPPSRDGIGKTYMGREIAQVMGHLGAGWLERPEREREEAPAKLVELLKLRPADTVADLGAGTGYFSFRMARQVPQGKVYAVDIQPEMLTLLRDGAAERDITNVEPVLGKVDDPNLPADSTDLALMVDAYHEFDFPREMMLGIVRGLKPGGRVALVEYRGEDPSVPIKPLHKMAEAQAVKEMTAVGLEHVETIESLPTQHLMLFRKPLAATQPASN